MRTFLQDLVYGFRNLRNARGFAIVAALTLAIGIGANTAIFSIIDTVLLRPLPYTNPHELVRLHETESAPGHYPFAGPDFADWKAQNTTFQDMTLYAWPNDVNLSSNGRPEHGTALPTAANFFSVLGVSALVGRTWVAGEDQPGKDDVVILSYGLWTSRYARDPNVIGQTLELNARKYKIVGVMPASFRFMTRSQMWVPQPMDSKGLGERGSHWANAIGRMKPGVTVEQARADLKAIAARLEKQYPNSNDQVGAAVIPLRDNMVGGSRDSLFLMLGAVGIVLLIACANVANLLLSRAMARHKEVAIRSALGASRMRLLRQLLTENLLLSLTGASLGLLIAWGAVTLFSKAQSYSLPTFNSIELNGTVLAFTFALAIVTGLLFGAFPALQMSRPALHDELKGGAGSSVSPSRARRMASNGLVVLEVALSLVLLASAGLLLKDFARMRGLDIGVRRDGIWTAAIMLPKTGYDTDRQKYDFSERLLETARRVGGVDAVAMTDHLPLEGGSNYYVRPRGRTGKMSNQLVERHTVSPDYFRAFGIRVVRGRVFNTADVQHQLEFDVRVREVFASGVKPSNELRDSLINPCIINESMAKFFWPNEDPLGKMFAQGGDHGPWRQVVGVVSDVRQWSLTQKPIPEAYDPFDGTSRSFLVLHTSMPFANVASEVRQAMGQIDSSLPLYLTRSMEEVVAGQAQGQQFMSALVGSFAAVAALLACIGIYGVISYLVTQRTREIGIRMSLGAGRARVLAEVLREGMQLAVLGLIVGVGGSFAVGKVLATFLREVKPGDPAIIGGTALLLALVTLVGCYIPARRAARVDPMVALRYE